MIRCYQNCSTALPNYLPARSKGNISYKNLLTWPTRHFLFILSLYMHLLYRYWNIIYLEHTHTHTMKCTSVTHCHIINHAHHVRSTRFHGKEEQCQCVTSCCRSTRQRIDVKGQSVSSSNMPPVYSNLPFLCKTVSICPFFDKNKSTQKENKACRAILQGL